MATSIVDDVRTPGRITDLVRWGPVVVALGFFALLNVLWLAPAHSVEVPTGPAGSAATSAGSSG